MRTLLLIGVLAIATAAQAQKQEPVKLAGTPKAEVLAAATKLADQVRGGRFPHVVRRDPALAQQFLWLAATHAEPEVVAASLEGMSRTFSRRAHKDRATVDENYRAVVRARLASTAGAVQRHALRAARQIMGDDKVDLATLDGVLALATGGSPAARIEAIRALTNVRDFQLPKARPGEIKAKVVKAIASDLSHADTAVVAVALDRLARSAYPDLPMRDALMTQARTLMASTEPAVRGNALILLGRLGKPGDGKVLGAEMVKAMGDSSPFVRAQAAEAAAALKHRPAIHAIARLLDDAAGTRVEMKPYKDLEGKSQRLRLQPDGGVRVDEAAIYALQLMTEGDASAERFKAPSIAGRDREPRRSKAVAQAKAWYAARKDKIAAE